MAAGANPDLENFDRIDSESESDDEDGIDGPNKEISSEEEVCIGATAFDLAEGNSQVCHISFTIIIIALSSYFPVLVRVGLAMIFLPSPSIHCHLFINL